MSTRLRRLIKPFSSMPERKCPVCHRRLTYRQKFERWFCRSCDLFTIGY